MILCNIAVAAHTGGVNRNQMLYDQCGTQEVAAHTGGVNRNILRFAAPARHQVAAHTGGVNRNAVFSTDQVKSVTSLPTRVA